jgi:hypothetical protein
MDEIERALHEAIKYLVASGDRTTYPDDPRLVREIEEREGEPGVIDHEGTG